MLVADKRTGDPTVSGLKRSGLSLARVCEKLEAQNGRRLAVNSNVLFSPSSYSQLDAASYPDLRAADVVSLYWINGGFVSPENLACIGKPLVWRLSDVWPFTGGCHYPGTCDHFETQCGRCPQLRRPGSEDAAKRLWLRKQEAWRALDLTITAPSNWMAGLARRSSLFSDRRIEVVPTGIDLSVFCPQDKSALRRSLNIPEDKLVIAFGALDLDGDIRKGYLELSVALRRIAMSPLAPRVLALIFGRKQLPDECLPIAARFLGRLNQDQALAAAYSAADIVVVPSLEDNLPNVALEAIGCGVPVCGFDVGGMPDIVRTGWNGHLVPLQDGRALADSMIDILSNVNLRRQMSENARAHAEQRFSIDGQARAYLKLYSELVNLRRSSVIKQ